MVTRLILVLLLFDQIVYAQANWQEGAFNTVTGRQLSFEQWMSLLPEKFDLFQEERPLELTLESDFKKFIREKGKSKYQDALLHYPIVDSVTIKRIVRIMPRGEFRKNYCSPPPVKLNFKHTKLYVNSIQQLEKMKMVSRCKNSRSDEEYVLKELLTYKLYNLFTDFSFRARLLKIKFIDTGWKKLKVRDSYGFLIEEADDLAKRNNVTLIKVKTATYKDVNDLTMARFALFQYMIGNTDWSITGTHNVKLLKKNDFLKPKVDAVPYDFDYSGFVNAHYAIPSEEFGIEHVRQRLFRCQCYSEGVFKKAIASFLTKKDEVYSTINDFPYLSPNVKKDLTSFIGEFYSQIESKNAVEYFLRNCGRLL